MDAVAEHPSIHATSILFEAAVFGHCKSLAARRCMGSDLIWVGQLENDRNATHCKAAVEMRRARWSSPYYDDTSEMCWLKSFAVSSNLN